MSPEEFCLKLTEPVNKKTLAAWYGISPPTLARQIQRHVPNPERLKRTNVFTPKLLQEVIHALGIPPKFPHK